MKMENMKQVEERPTEGQWVELWVYKKEIWSDTYRMCGGEIYIFNEESDEWDKNTMADANVDIFFFVSTLTGE
jgi:hypothetical protein